MKRIESANAWTLWTLYGSYALVYAIPFLACSAHARTCDPSLKDNYLSVSRVIRQTYWNTSFAFVSALFISSLTYVLLLCTTSRFGRIAVVCSALCGIVPAVVPLNEHEGWDAVDVVHTAFAVASALFQAAYLVWILQSKSYAEWRAPLAVSAAVFFGATVALAAATGARWGADSETEATKFTYFAAEYAISATIFTMARTVVVANQS